MLWVSHQEKKINIWIFFFDEVQHNPYSFKIHSFHCREMPNATLAALQLTNDQQLYMQHVHALERAQTRTHTTTHTQ